MRHRPRPSSSTTPCWFVGSVGRSLGLKTSLAIHSVVSSQSHPLPPLFLFVRSFGKGEKSERRLRDCASGGDGCDVA